MITQNGVLAAVLLSFVNYYFTTFSIWSGHWFSHLKWSPLAVFHMSGHHVIYSNSQHFFSKIFRYGTGRQDSSFALVPPLILQAIMLYLILPLPLFLICFIQGIILACLIGYIHIQTHIPGSKLEKFDWFMKARYEHARHHDVDMNFMVGDPFWDKFFKTYLPGGNSSLEGLSVRTDPPLPLDHVAR